MILRRHNKCQSGNSLLVSLWINHIYYSREKKTEPKTSVIEESQKKVHIKTTNRYINKIHIYFPEGYKNVNRRKKLVISGNYLCGIINIVAIKSVGWTTLNELEWEFKHFLLLEISNTGCLKKFSYF